MNCDAKTLCKGFDDGGMRERDFSMTSFFVTRSSRRQGGVVARDQRLYPGYQCFQASALCHDLVVCPSPLRRIREGPRGRTLPRLEKPALPRGSGAMGVSYENLLFREARDQLRELGMLRDKGQKARTVVCPTQSEEVTKDLEARRQQADRGIRRRSSGV